MKRRITVSVSGVTENEYVYEDDGLEAVTAATVLASFGLTHGDCGGNGRCGKCRVRIEGSVSPISDDEAGLLGKSENIAEQVGNERLACRAVISGNAHIYCTYTTNDEKIQVLTEGLAPYIKINPCLQGKTGVAADIGTTTLVFRTCDLRTGTVISTVTKPNPQRAFGADVMSRVERSAKGEAAVGEVLRDALKENIGDADAAALTGNTVMLSYASGKPVNGFAEYPFTPPSLFGHTENGVYSTPCASAFFGGDVVCGLAVCAEESVFPMLFADIGTNGEIAVADRVGEKTVFTCCSAAAGPCFEGGGITCGMPASDGAVYRVARKENGEYLFETLGGAKAKGLCGSGLADLAAMLLEEGVIDFTGYMKSAKYLSENVYLTPADVRNLQLAKAAIRGGIETLLDVTGTRGRIKRLYLAGGMGSSLDVGSAATLGIIPPELAAVAVKAGNTALSGATAALLDTGFREKLNCVARSCETYELAGSDIFAEHYMKHMGFDKPVER